MKYVGLFCFEKKYVCLRDNDNAGFSQPIFCVQTHLMITPGEKKTSVITDLEILAHIPDHTL